MKTVRLECSRMTDREAVHSCLSHALDLPAWYGRNLDALYDLLTSWEGPLCLELADPDHLTILGDYGRSLLNTLRDAALENPNLTLTISSLSDPS